MPPWPSFRRAKRSTPFDRAASGGSAATDRLLRPPCQQSHPQLRSRFRFDRYRSQHRALVCGLEGREDTVVECEEERENGSSSGGRAATYRTERRDHPGTDAMPWISVRLGDRRAKRAGAALRCVALVPPSDGGYDRRGLCHARCRPEVEAVVPGPDSRVWKAGSWAKKNWRERTLKRDVGRSASEVVTARRRRGGEETTRQVEGTCVSDWFDPSRRPNTARGVFDMPIIGIATWTTGTLMI